MRKNISGNSPWEDIVGYSRAVRIGNIFEIAGTTAVRDGKPYAAGNAYEQTKYILENIKKLLEKEGLGLKNVIRTRMFVTDISKWEEYGKAHGEFPLIFFLINLTPFKFSYLSIITFIFCVSKSL